MQYWSKSYPDQLAIKTECKSLTGDVILHQTLSLYNRSHQKSLRRTLFYATTCDFQKGNWDLRQTDDGHPTITLQCHLGSLIFHL